MDLSQLETILATGFSQKRQPEYTQNDLPIAPDGDNDEAIATRSMLTDGPLHRPIRSEKITVRVTPTQKQSLLQWCRGMDLSTYIRLFVFDLRTNQMLARMIPTINRQTYLELMQINEVIRQQLAIVSQQLSNSDQQNSQEFEKKLVLYLQQLQQLEALIREIRLAIIAPVRTISRHL